MESSSNNTKSKHTQSIDTSMHSSDLELFPDFPWEELGYINEDSSESLASQAALNEEVDSYDNALPAETALLHLESVSIAQKDQLPNVPGIYFVMEDGHVIYIGLSKKSILRRWWTHEKLKDLRARKGEIKIAWLECRAIELLPLMESTFIGYFNPELNQTVGEGILRYFKHIRQQLESADTLTVKKVELRKSDWLIVEEIAAKLKISVDEALMWIIRLGSPDTISKYKIKMKRLDKQLEQS